MVQSVHEVGTALHVASRPVVQPHTHRAKAIRLMQVAVAGGDLVVILLATVLATWGRYRLTFFEATEDVTAVAQSVGIWIVVGWMLVNVVMGTYQTTHLGVGTTEYAKILGAAGMTAGLIGITSYLTKFNLSRGFFVLLFVVGVPLLLLWRWTTRRLVHRLHLRGHLVTKVLIAGSARHVDEVAAVLDRESWLGYRIVGALLPATQALHATPRGVPVVGLSTETALATRDHEADLVVFTEGAFQSSTDFRRIAWDLEGHHVQMAVVPSLSDISSGRMMMRPVGGLPLVHVEQPQSLGASRGLKRAFDVVGGGVAILLSAPLMLGVAVALKLQDGGPILFRQTRVGRDGTFFECLKFRSMVVDAEARLSAVKHLQDDPENILFKAQSDPRITSVGRFIRRYSVDELPQLFNVVRGEMSLVGPRPALPAEVRRYSQDVQRRLHVRPGMTGLWQVSGRSDLSWEDTVRLDLYYVDNWSLVQDLSIVVKTVHAVLGSRGAY